MIVCTLGTHPQPFNRALDWLLPVVGDEELVVQHGATPPRPEVADVCWRKFLDYEDLAELIESADIVVCHAGVGTLMTAIGLGSVPVALPRLSAGGEHVDDHQLQIATELGRSGYVVACTERGALAPALERCRHAPPPSRTRAMVWDKSLGGELRNAAIVAAGGNPDTLRESP